MNEQQEFFSPKHKQLLSIATWAKYLAWIVLVIYFIRTGLVVIQNQIGHQQMQAAMGSPISTQEYWDMVLSEPTYYLIDIGSDMVSVLLRGFIYYVVLKGISLGLNMIVETDIN